MFPKISVCIITRNNEKTLPACLESIKTIAEEIIIVDTGSEDKTKEIAKSFNARIFDYSWNNNFSDAKNSAVEKATGKWILNMDADETISYKDLQKIKELTDKESSILGYYLIQKNYTNETGEYNLISTKDDDYEESKIAKGFTERKMLRLFKNDKRIRFEGAVHDSVIKSIERIGNNLIQDTEIPIHHFGYLGRKSNRTERYIEIEKQNIKEDYFQYYQIASQLHSIGKLNEAAEYLMKSLKLNPEFYLTYLELAIIWIKRGKISESKPILIKSLQLNQTEMAWNHLGIVEAYEKNFEKAVGCFKNAISINPRNADLYFNLGNSLKQAGKVNEAKEAYEKAVYLNPDYKNQIK